MTNRARAIGFAAGDRVTLASGAGRGGTITAPSSVLPGWIVAWDLSNIRTHEPAAGLLAATVLPKKFGPGRAAELLRRRA